MSVVAAQLSKNEARSLTDEIKGDAERLWAKLLEAYEGGAHTALGYDSWGDYFETEFGGTQAKAYRLLDAGKVASILKIENGSAPNEAQARELAPLLDKPDELREAWSEVVEETGGKPTAASVRAKVQRAPTPRKNNSRSEKPGMVEYLPDQYADDALRNLRTQTAAWIETGLYLARLIKEGERLIPKSDTDREGISNDLKRMEKVIHSLKEMI